jgi:peptidoglycan/LPS O-acetylase OafA/YrhL
LASQSYRSDIDGLRAIAVLAVVFFHASPSKLPGGFTGVDVFFVISGFLISSHIYSQLKENRFAFRDFYSRRIRRIFPALSVVLASTVALGWVILAPDQYRQFSKHLMGGSGFVANFLYWQEAGYFDDLALQKPLLHLWSLAIEEQFYIFWPIILLLGWRFYKKIFPLLLVLLAASFTLNVICIGNDPTGTFYSPLTRAWELLVGAGLGIFQIENPLPMRRWSSVRSWIGLGLVGYGIFGLDESNFPGWRALFPTIGTLLVISSGPTAWPNRKYLSIRAMVWVGLISYPLYLWHWPLLSFMNEFTPGGHGIKFAVIGLSFLLAWLTYRFLEIPIRGNRKSHYVIPSLCTAMILLFICGAALVASDGAPGRFPSDINQMMRKYDSRPDYRFGTCFIDIQGHAEIAETCIDKEPATGELLVLWGDSHAAHLYPGLSAKNTNGKYRIAQFTATSCPPLVGGDTGKTGRCAEINLWIRNKISELKPRVVVLGSRWDRDKNDLDIKLSETVRFLRSQGVQEVYVAGPPPSWRPALRTVLFKNYLLHGSTPERLFPNLDSFADIKREDETLEKICRDLGIKYLSAVKVLCNSNGCLTFVDSKFPDGLVTSDYDHFTSVSSKYFIEHSGMLF